MSLLGGLGTKREAKPLSTDREVKERMIVWLRQEADEELEKHSNDDIIREIVKGGRVKDLLNKAERKEAELAQSNRSPWFMGILFGIAFLFLARGRKK